MKKLLIALLLVTLLVPMVMAGVAPALAAYVWPTPDYEELERNPDKYVSNSSYTVKGTVLGVSESKYGDDFKISSGTMDVILCLQPDEDGATKVYLHYFRKCGEPRILEGDYLIATAYGGGLSVYWDYKYPFAEELPFFFAYIQTVNGDVYPPEAEE